MKSTFQHFYILYTLVYLNIWKYICSGCYTTQWVLSTLYTSRIFIINISKYTCTQLHIPHFTWRSKEIFGPETWAGPVELVLGGVAGSASVVCNVDVLLCPELVACSGLLCWDGGGREGGGAAQQSPAVSSSLSLLTLDFSWPGRAQQPATLLLLLRAPGSHTANTPSPLPELEEPAGSFLPSLLL